MHRCFSTNVFGTYGSSIAESARKPYVKRGPLAAAASADALREREGQRASICSLVDVPMFPLSKPCRELLPWLRLH
jgi:hypothetical protein